MTDLNKLKSGTDIRGKALGEDAVITPDTAFRLAAAFALWLRQKGAGNLRIGVGHDSRLTGESLSDAVCRGLNSVGAQAEDYGMCTTPSMFMCLVTEGFACDAAVMVTASHHPFDRNGIKFITREGITGSDLDEIIALASRDIPSVPETGSTVKRDFLSVYAKQLMDLVRGRLDTDNPKPLSGLHVVVDAGNGAGGFYAAMLEELGARTEGSQFLAPDGRFPNHIPNPENGDAMESVSEAVRKAGADLGVIFDADCDRAAIVDGNGKQFNRNRLIALISAVLLDQEPGATIVTDSVTSSGLARFIQDRNGVHYRYKRGYRNVIDEARLLNENGVSCPLAIETSGHAALRENYFLDDGMYLVTLLICEAMRLKRNGRELGDLIAQLREPVESAEIRLPILAEDFRTVGNRVIERVLAHASAAPGWHIAPDNREGVRISFDLQNGTDNGWFLLRLSVHDPVLPLNLESDVPGGNKVMAAGLYTVLKDMNDIGLEALAGFIR